MGRAHVAFWPWLVARRELCELGDVEVMSRRWRARP